MQKILSIINQLQSLFMRTFGMQTLAWLHVMVTTECHNSYKHIARAYLAMSMYEINMNNNNNKQQLYFAVLTFWFQLACKTLLE